MASPGCVSAAATAKARRLGAWLDEVVSFHAVHTFWSWTPTLRYVPVCCWPWREPLVSSRTSRNSWIAASAELHGMTVLTFNETDFLPMGVAVCNPGVALPPEARPPA